MVLTYVYVHYVVFQQPQQKEQKEGQEVVRITLHFNQVNMEIRRTLHYAKKFDTCTTAV